jgi:hypothetical protein
MRTYSNYEEFDGIKNVARWSTVERVTNSYVISSSHQY